MPSYDPVRRRLLSEIEYCIPRNWKGSRKHIDVSSNNGSDSNTRLSSFLNSLKDFTIKGQLSQAFIVYSLIRHHVISTSYRSSRHAFVLSISPLLEACANNSQFLSQGRQLHSQSIRLGVNRHHHLLRSLVTFYSSFNLVFDAHCVAESSNNMNPLHWNLVIASYVRNGLFQEALSVYRQMLDTRIRPDDFTFPSVLKACGEQLNLAFGKEIHRTIAASSRKCSVYVLNALISMYGKCGELQVARNLFDEMLERDPITWNSIVAVYASKGMWKEAFDLFERMLSEVNEVSIIMWNTIAGGLMHTGKFVEALKLLSKTRTNGIHVDDVGTVIGLTACSHVQDIELGQQFHASAIHGGCDGYHNVKNALITMYSRCEDLRDAYIVFQLTDNKSIITWNAIISGYSYCCRLDEASFLFREMLLSGFEPNHVTIASILPLCGRVADLQHGREFHCYILRREGFTGHLLLWNSIIDMYVRSGKVFQAKGVFDTLNEKNEITYTSLIAGYGAQGRGEVALNLFKEMCCYGIKPDHITLLAVLSACSHSGLVNHGQLLFDKMESNYGIMPCLEHFACMVDLFARAGLLRKAAEVIRGMPYQPTPEMWVTLLGACHVRRNMNLGEWAAEKLLEMKPTNSGYYVLIANMYAAAGCWSKLAGVRTLMRDLGVSKASGYAWVDLGTGFQPFSAGDASADLIGEIYLLLEGMTEQIKDDPHGATEDFVMDAGISKECPIAEDCVDVKIWGSLVL